METYHSIYAFVYYIVITSNLTTFMLHQTFEMLPVYSRRYLSFCQGIHLLISSNTILYSIHLDANVQSLQRRNYCSLSEMFYHKRYIYKYFYTLFRLFFTDARQHLANIISKTKFYKHEVDDELWRSTIF